MKLFLLSYKTKITLIFALIILCLDQSFSQSPNFLVYPKYDNPRTNSIIILYTNADPAWQRIKIYRRTSGGIYTFLSGPAVNPSLSGIYTDNTIIPDIGYEYKFEAIDAAGNTIAIPMTISTILNSVNYWPTVDGSDDILTNFGEPASNLWTYHEGIDILGMGKKIKAIRGGQVYYVDRSIGNIVIKIDIGNAYEYDSYLHLTNISISINNSCAAGQEIGEIGNFYDNAFCHLHLSLLDSWLTSEPDGVDRSNGQSFLNPFDLFGSIDPKNNIPGLHSEKAGLKDFLLRPNQRLNVYMDPKLREPAFDKISIIAAASDVMNAIGMAHHQGINSIGYYITNISGKGKSVKSVNDPYVLFTFNDNWFGNALGKINYQRNGANLIPIIEDPLNTGVNYCLKSGSPDVTYYQHYKLTNASKSKLEANVGEITMASVDENWNTLAMEGTGSKANGSDANTTPINQFAQFKDGGYAVHAVMNDLLNSNDEEVYVLVDNFRPYIQKVEIKSGSVDVYNGEWVWNAATQALNYVPNGKGYSNNPSDGIINIASRDEDVTIKVTASEALKELTIDDIVASAMVTPLTLNYPIVGSPLSNDSTEWGFTINSNVFKADGTNDGIHYIHFNGKDLLNNQLECFSPAKPTYTAAEIPKRTDKTTWSIAPHTAQGYDNMHCFSVGTGVPPNNLNISINASLALVSVNTPVTFNAVLLGGTADPNDYTYNWTFKDGINPPKTLTGNSSITTSFPNNALITAELTLTQNSTTVGYGVKKDIVNVGSVLQSGIVIDKEMAQIGEVITVSASPKGGTGNYTYYWSFSGDCSKIYSGSSSETISYSSLGTKTIILIVSDGISSKTITEDIVITDIPQLEVDFQNVFDDNYIIAPNTVIQFMSNVQNATGTCRYWWDFGDGTSFLDLSRSAPCPSHVYTVVGNYTVTLQVTADNGTRIVSHTYRVSNLGTLNACFTATPAPSSPSATFTITSNEKVYDAYLLFGDGTMSNNFSISPTTPVIITHTYNYTYTYSAYLMVNYQGELRNACEQSVTLNGTPSPPILSINLTDDYPVNKPWVGADIVGLPMWLPNRGETSLDSPNEIERGEDYYYECHWLANYTNFFSHEGEPYTYLNVNNPVIQAAFSKKLPFTFNLSLEVYDGNNKCHKVGREVRLYPPIAVDLKTDYPACENSTIEIIPKVTGGAPPYTYKWIHGSTQTIDPNIVINVGSQPVTYTLKIGDSRSGMNGCDHYYEKSFTVTPTPLLVEAGNTVRICGINAISSINANASGGGGKYNVSWEPFNNLSSASVLQPKVASPEFGSQIYKITVADQYGCVSSDQVTVNFFDAVRLEMPPDFTLGCGDIKTLTPIISGGSGTYNYQWSNGAATKDINLSSSQLGSSIYSLTTTDQNGCSNSGQVTANIFQVMNIEMPADLTIGCQQTKTISPNVTGGSGNYAYHWSNNLATKDIIVDETAPLSLSLTVTDNNTGCSAQASVNILTVCNSITSTKRYQRGVNSYTMTIPVIAVPGIIAYTAHTDCSWLSITSGATGYSTGGNINLTVSANNTTYDRTGKVIIESQGAINSPYEIEIKQTTYNTILVPAEYTKIQDAIDAAPNEGKVEVDEGTYIENLTFYGPKKISVKGTGCPENTIIKAKNHTTAIVEFSSNNSVFQGFTLDGNSNTPRGYGGGINIYYGNPQLLDLIISNNIAYIGGGVCNMYGNPKLVNVKLEDNSADRGCAMFSDFGNPILQNVLFVGNSPYISYEGRSLEISGNALLNNVTLFNNYGGLSFFDGIGKSSNINNCIITDGILNTGTINISYSDINASVSGSGTVSWGSGNINVNPKFDGYQGLMAGSPCINAGDPTKINKDGSRADMGWTGGKGIYNKSVQVCTKASTPTLLLGQIQIAGNCVLTYGYGENENFVASHGITIGKGFEANAGSNLSFSIQPYYNEPFLYDGKCQSFLKSDLSPFDSKRNQNELIGKDDKKFDFIVYPIPTGGEITIKLYNTDEIKSEVAITNALGVVVKRLTLYAFSNDLDISELSLGVYFIKINSGGFSKTKMIVKE
jgi:hypothetical protein